MKRNFFYISLFGLFLLSFWKPFPIEAEIVFYTVKAGESLESIEEKFSVSASVLMKLNRLESEEELRKRVREGTSLLIPEPVQLASAKLPAAGAGAQDPEQAAIRLIRPLEPNVLTIVYHQVEKGDTLFYLSVLYGISEEEIRRANQLEGNLIRIGSKLRIPRFGKSQEEQQFEPALEGGTEPVYRVKPGDTLSMISRETGISVEDLRKENNLTDSRLSPGQTLRLPLNLEAGSSPASRPGSDVYVVQSGDTLIGTAKKFGVTVEELTAWNGLLTDLLQEGQTLKLGPPPLPEPAEDFEPYTIVEGDTLWSISRRFGSDVSSVREWNPELEDVLIPGKRIRLRKQPPALPVRDVPKIEQKKEIPAVLTSPASDNPGNKTKLVSLPFLPDSGAKVELKHYFYRDKPAVPSQPSAVYYEEFADDPLKNYGFGLELLEKFDREIDAMPKLGDELAGYTILIDPGHGGLDPGFNSESEDGDQNTLYIIEDEYNYDYALRLYRNLKRHGAKVGLTLLSPNHLLINSPDSSRTLVSQKNEVYNSPFLNHTGEYKSWPIGTSEGLRKRVDVAESFFNGVKEERSIFISLHNDNSPWDRDGRLVMYYDDDLTVDALGKRMARNLVENLGKDAHYRGQNLAVLRNNPARYAVLVEMRNIAYQRNAWAIRNADLREEDSRILSRAVIRFVQSLD